MGFCSTSEWLGARARHAAGGSHPLERDAQRHLTLKITGEKLPSALLCLGEIWGPGCLSPILRGEGWRPHPPSHPMRHREKRLSQAQAWGSDKGRIQGGCSRATPAFVCSPAVAPQKCSSQPHPVAVRALRMPHGPGVTVAIESPFHAQECGPSWGSGSFPEHLPGAAGWTAGMENRRAHTRESQRGGRGEIGVT